MVRNGIRLLGALAVAAASAFALAQPVPTPPAMPASPPPPAVVPLPPPMPDSFGSGEVEMEPQVTIIRRETETVEEVRVNGELRYIRVTPKVGLTYYLVPNGNGQTFIRRDSLDFGLKAPMWLLFSW